MSVNSGSTIARHAIKARWIGVLLALGAASAHPAFAQTCPGNQSTPQFTAGGNVFGRVGPQWNAYFGNKVDVNNGTLCNPTITGTLNFLGLVTASQISTSSLTVTGAISLPNGLITAAMLASGAAVANIGYTPANLVSPVFSGMPTAPTPSLFDNSTRLATTAYVQGQGYTATFNPYNYGTIGSGDDQPAIQAAVIAAETDIGSPGAGTGCVSFPAKMTPWVIMETVTLGEFGCVKGQGIISTMVQAPNDTTAFQVNSSFNSISDMMIVGNADKSSVATHTYGINLASIETVLSDVYIEDFASCVGFDAPSIRHTLRGVYCNEQNYYPNLNNHFPWSSLEFEIGTSPRSNQAIDVYGGELRGQPNVAAATFSGNGSTTFFDASLPTGDHLWSAMGITTSVGGVVKSCGADYTLWDITASGGGGSGGVQLACGVITATLNGTAVATVSSSTTGIPTGATAEVRAWQGIPLATSIVSIVPNTSITLSNPATWSGSVALWFYQIAVGGANKLATCYIANTCGEKVEVRYNTAPVAGTNNVAVNWIDPTMYADVDAENATNVRIMPHTSSGAIYGLYQPAVGAAGRGDVTYKPTYVEIEWLPETIFGAIDGEDVKIPNDMANDVGPDLVGGAIPGYYDPVNVTNSVIQYSALLNFVGGMAPAVNGVPITAP